MKDSFQQWWNDHYFSTNSFYSQFQKIHHIGGDLDLIDRLSETVRFYDFLVRLSRGKRKQQASSRIKLLLAQAAFRGMLHGSVDTNKCIEIADEIVDRERSRKLPRGAKSKSDYREIIKQLAQELGSVLGENEFPKWKSIMLEIVFAERIGGRPDEWGTLFLVCLTEHFKAKTRKPYHALAMRTLKAIRNKTLDSQSSEGENAKSRVRQFKTRHKDWSTLLEALQGK
jgi:hypothetical protein